MEARHRQMRTGPHENHGVEKYDNGGATWAYNSALDNFAGERDARGQRDARWILFGIGVNETRGDNGMLHVSFRGTAPKMLKG